ncbi:MULTISPECIES: acyltransferase [unclassified Photobacterium]|uniref:acyltransferase family protein n=1 Tax=unclassified Photobacterium TaxID=2628852 RepID=UPI001EDFEDC1|nr:MULTISPECIES: acyltransferase [unclassified Photobacterium]MCG3863212.1 acyltransferase [Photobacterium sp. Ph6]MCG3874742.1 acyltransferase [Photobacterium sp. Ph5]
MVKKELKGLTALRCYSAFYVVIFHLNRRVPIDFGHYINKFISNGAVGMSFFFILSGFVMAYNYNSDNLKNYYIKRFLRIYPAYFFMGVLTLPFLFIMGYENKTILTSLLIFIVPIQSWFYQSFGIWNFGGSWSISTELFFYILFPTILTMIKDKNLIVVLILSYILSSLIIPLSKELSVNINSVFSVYYATPIYRLPEFVIGVSLGKLYLSGMRVGKGLFLFSLFIFIYTMTKNNDFYMGSNYILIPSIIVVILYLAHVDIGFGFFSKVVIFLGKISFSFYLMQLPLLMLVDYINPVIESNSEKVIFWFVFLLVNTFFSFLSYKYIESNKRISEYLFGIYKRCKS